MRIYKDMSHPLRVYVEDETPGEVSRLRTSLDRKYAPPSEGYLTNMKYELDSILFYDEEEGRSYIVHGLLNILLKESSVINIRINNEVDSQEINLVYPDIDNYLLEGIELRNYQLEGISSALAYKRGLIKVHTGGGKTEMMIGVCRYLLDTTESNILLCVPTTNLLYQTHKRAVKRGIPDDAISLLGDGNKMDTSKRIMISTVQSAYQKLGSTDEYMDWLEGVGCLMMDEAHHSQCRTWSTLIDRVAPEYLLGFTAEPFHNDKNHIISDLVLRGLIGPVIHNVTMDYLVKHGYLARPCVLALDSTYKGSLFKVVDWRIVNKSGIVNNVARNEFISKIAQFLIESNRRPLLLVQQIAHGQTLAKLISSLGYSVYMMTGGMKISIYINGMDVDHFTDSNNTVIKDFDEGKIDVLIGTSTLDEGVDIPSLSSVILAGGGKGRLKTVQRIGRSMRPKSEDNTTYIVDFRDRFNVVTSSHFKKRKALYDELSMPVYYPMSLEAVSKIMQEFSAIYSNSTES